MLRRLIATAAVALPLPAAADLGINFYGLAYHFDRSRARDVGLDNEIIAGLGLRYRVPHSERLQWVFEAGAYRDSGRNTARVAGAGALWKLTPKSAAAGSGTAKMKIAINLASMGKYRRKKTGDKPRFSVNARRPSGP